VLAQLDVLVPLAAQTRKQASRGDSIGPQAVQSSSEMPQVERQLEVEVSFAMQTA
jgi:hypothetical protein